MFAHVTDHPIVCPACGSWDVNPSSHAHHTFFLRFIAFRKLYSCDNCGWKGYVSKEKHVPMAFLIMTAIIVFVALLSLIVK